MNLGALWLLLLFFFLDKKQQKLYNRTEYKKYTIKVWQLKIKQKRKILPLTIIKKRGRERDAK
jgi:hypothetical protein